MGTVYLAEQRQHSNRQCVIKQLTNKYSDPYEQAEAVRLFQREALLLRQLDHPGIVRVFDSHATEDGRYFLVMDYVPGKNLEIMLQTGGIFSSDFATHLAIQCCEVLEYLHTREMPIIYRDLKPSNLMLTPDGRIVFVDFGIARVFMPKQAATRVVTAGYSPPEQYFGKPETRSDLYSLGATMNHLVTGKRPRPLTVCMPQMVNPEVHPQLSDLIKRLTSQTPDERPASARQVRHELYRIYKQFDAGFEIPQEALMEPEEPVNGSRRRQESLVGQPALNSPLLFSAGQDDATTGFWQRLKQWWQIWLS
jgi:serine/threonine protein kinase